jgi:hypothetical protein
MANGRRQLFDHVKSFYFDNYEKNLTDPKVNVKVSKPLSHHRAGVISPQRTNKGYIQKSVGEPSALSKAETKSYNKKPNPKHNPKNNKKNNKKRKDQNDAENRKTIENQGLGQDMRSKTEVDDLCEHLLNEKKYPILGNQTSMSHAIETKSHAIYIGTTKRALTEEDLRWMTARGAQDQRGTAKLIPCPRPDLYYQRPCCMLFWVVEAAYTQQGRAHIRRLRPDWAERPALVSRAAHAVESKAVVVRIEAKSRPDFVAEEARMAPQEGAPEGGRPGDA